MTLPPPEPPATPTRRWQLPPAWRRRLSIAGGGVLALGLIALAATTLIVSDEDESEPTWDAVAVLDEETGEIATYDADGDELSHTDTGLDEVVEFTTRGEHALVRYDDEDGDDDDNRDVALVDLRNGEVEKLDLSVGDDIEWATTTHAPVAVISESDDGNITLVDAVASTEVDVADAAALASPMMDGDEVLSSADGHMFAMTDRSSFQTVLVDIETGEPQFVPPGELVAMSDETVMTLQRTGNTGDLTFTGLDGDRNAPAQAPTPVAVELIDSHEAVLARADGRLLRIGSGDAEPSPLIDLADELDRVGDEDQPTVPGDTDGTEGEVETADDSEATVEIDEMVYLTTVERIIAAAGETVFVLSTDGEVIARIDDHELWRTPETEDECVSVVSENDMVRLLDAESGEELAAGDRGSSRSPIASSIDGCTIDTDRSATTVLSPEGTRELDGQVLDIAADGTAVLTRSEPGTVELTLLANEDATPLELDGDVATFLTEPVP